MGKSWKEKVSFLVPDVNSFPGHISCNANSKSEIVIPVKTKDNKVFMVLDIDSDKLNDLDKSIVFLNKFLEKLDMDAVTTGDFIQLIEHYSDAPAQERAKPVPVPKPKVVKTSALERYERQKNERTWKKIYQN